MSVALKSRSHAAEAPEAQAFRAQHGYPEPSRPAKAQAAPPAPAAPPVPATKKLDAVCQAIVEKFTGPNAPDKIKSMIARVVARVNARMGFR